MKRTRNASPGPSKRTRPDDEHTDSPESPLPPRPSLLPARPPRPTVGLAMMSARANQVLKELDEGDKWCHVDNRSRQELHGWTWEERLDATGALVRTPIAFSQTTVTVGNIRLSWYNGDEELLKRSLYQIFAKYGRIVSIWPDLADYLGSHISLSEGQGGSKVQASQARFRIVFTYGRGYKTSE